MSIAQALLGEWEHEIVATKKVLERIPADKMDYRPHEKSMTFGALANHVATIPLWGQTTATSDQFDFNPPGGEMWQPPKTDSAEELVALFEQASDGFKAVLGSVSDEAMMKPWSLLNGGQAMFTMPKVVVLRSFIFNHLYHHRGQLTVYLRMLDIPVPAVYGPSADEQS